MSDDFYALLGVDKNASQQDIKRAYRELARQLHPDKNPGNLEAESRFKLVAEAYRVIGDVDLRAKYDQHVDQKGASEKNGADLFDEIFGTRSAKAHARDRRSEAQRSRPSTRPRHASERGHDLRYTMDLDFVDAALGTERTIMIPRPERCETCGGTGARPGTSPVLCQRCGGSGTVQSQQGFFDVSSTCPKCRGKGKMSAQTCGACQGSGLEQVERPIAVKVPPGVDTGTRLKLAGEGEPGPGGGPRGDLYVVANIKPHPLFQREEDDILTDVPVTFAQAALGAQLEIPTLEGKVRMRIPAGSQTGRVFRLKGKGIPSLNGRGRGDQRVRIIVETPTSLTDRERELFEQLAEDEGDAESHAQVAEFRRLLEQYLG
jgi:molecular chaperone DnaJ